ncbi:hypothetical protein ACNS7O_07235 [Haloferacaceae archaeon DSL9]
MNRHVPEFALLTGLVLGGTALVVGVALVGTISTSLLVCALFVYPFSAYAVHHDEDPTNVLPPRLVFLLGCVAGAVIWLDTVFAAPDPVAAVSRGFTLGLLVAVPTGLYAARYGTPPAALTPRRGVVALWTLAASALAVGAATSAPVAGTAGALVLFWTGLTYARAGGLVVSRARRRRAVVAGLVLGAGCFALGAVTGTLDSWAIPGVAAIFGPTLWYAATLDAPN